ncbi:response regulator (plasmid) [Polymorphobacter sp. PAMC 29334]|uniref:response regulator n=1 Tax=Polymorphobacter sp. PAMC 29334 TaxID=2862331 RepID=UPI001C78ADB2|nr:response regulator [Polymorphobacter sp. PAMC 29334]QYE32980.1 response regulator [Polymorphobacter sp. PAMC 29334]
MVDDEVIARHALADYLQQCGYAVIAAASTEEAMTVLNAPDYVVSAMLCALPAIGSQNGLRLCRWVRDNHPTIKIDWPAPSMQRLKLLPSFVTPGWDWFVPMTQALSSSGSN